MKLCLQRYARITSSEGLQLTKRGLHQQYWDCNIQTHTNTKFLLMSLTHSETNGTLPKFHHIGIDLNSIISTKTLPFELDNGGFGVVVIKYSTKLLNVILVFPTFGNIYTLPDTGS
ncbi:hypothetical protein VNO78_21686 [Psophocarpus tetragonolobus]|uniref:Legume lectin domain-containing protein n=1 Tax=Psophocarpus tetragonolobus TaxID=3891 RepID=A0AAN9SD59_PSOTE